MDWHKDQNARAENHYPRRGRKGKKMTGLPSKMVLWRQKQVKLVDKYIAAHLDLHQSIPPRDIALADIDNRRLGDLIEAVHGPDRIEKVERVIPKMPNGEPVLDYVRRQARKEKLTKCPFPQQILHKIQKGLFTVLAVSELLNISEEIVQDYYNTFTMVVADESRQ